MPIPIVFGLQIAGQLQQLHSASVLKELTALRALDVVWMDESAGKAVFCSGCENRWCPDCNHDYDNAFELLVDAYYSGE